MAGGLSPATVILVVEAVGLVFIGLVSVAGFSVLAQRRLRALGMLSAIGATERNLRLVMIANGLAVGMAAALAGAVLGFAAWFAYVPALQQATGHVVDAANLPWWAIASGSCSRSRRRCWRPAARPRRWRGAGGGRAVRPSRAAKAVRRSALPGVIIFAGGIACLAFTGGWPGRGPREPARARAAPAGRPGRRDRRHRPARPAGHRRAGGRRGPRLPVAIRIALRNLVRYRARSGAALAAATFAVFLAMGICVVASVKFDDPLDLDRPQPVQQPADRRHAAEPGRRLMRAAQRRPGTSLGGRVNSLAASLHAGPRCRWNPRRHAVPGGRGGPQDNFSGTVYVATPRLLAAYGIKASQIAPGTDILTMRPGLAGLPHMEMIWGNPAARSRPNPCPVTAALRPARWARLPGQPRDTDGQRLAQRHLRAEHGDHRVRGEQISPAVFSCTGG